MAGEGVKVKGTVIVTVTNQLTSEEIEGDCSVQEGRSEVEIEQIINQDRTRGTCIENAE